MTFSAELVRPEDLVHLRVTGVNLVLDPSDPEAPAIVVEDPDQDGYLTVEFPAQSIAESAYFEWDIVKIPAESDPKAPKATPPDPPTTDPSGHEPLSPPGRPIGDRSVAALISRPSRLVFRVRPGTRIPFSLAGLLDWSQLELSVSPIAAIGRNASAADIAGAPAPAPPGATETAIELPFQLVISPNAAVAWKHRSDPFTSRGRTELWHTRLALKGGNEPIELSAKTTAPLRAIWSDDYRPDDPPQPSEVDRDLRRTAMTPNDRYQLVVLTAAFHGWEAEEEFKLFIIAGSGRIGQKPISVTRMVRHVPKPFEAEHLMLSPMGGWLKSEGRWTPPIQVRPPKLRIGVDDVVRTVLLRPRVAPPFDVAEALPEGAEALAPAAQLQQLDLSEWVHRATLGRDHYVRIVYEGELWPFRHRASLVKVTERKFKESGGVVGAYLMQRMFIVVREPEKEFSDRGNPFRRVRLTTLVTPNIAPPSPPPPGTKRTFWVEVFAGPGRTLFPFHAIGTDVGGNQVDFTLPLLFVSISDVNSDPSNLPAVAGTYNGTSMTDKRNLTLLGQKVLFAEPGSNDNTRLVAETMNYVVDPTGAPPRLLKADVRVPQVQELLGTDELTTIALLDTYVKDGFDAATGAFARIAKLSPTRTVDALASMNQATLGVDFQAATAGGIATPNMKVTALTQKMGPLAGRVEDAITGTWKPAEFFPPGTAQLFGTFDLTVLLSSGGLGDNAPKMVTRRVGDNLVTTLTWTPAVAPLDLTIAAFVPTAVTRLKVLGTITKPLAPPNATPTSTIDGTLDHFDVSVLKSVFIHFVEFHFVAKTGAKTDITVKLDPGKPVTFANDLRFVEEIRKAIPPDLFGDGPSIDISPTGIRAGFSFALPPLAVGVFALKDVSLGAALTLPFTDGKPVFDFNVSERAHPFLLTVSLFAGGGFFRLQIDTAGMKSLEIALEFGAAAAIDIGVASGEVHIMAGIYFGLQRKEGSTKLDAVLTGYLRLGGSLSVLGLIKVSVEFNLSFTYDGAKDKAYGRATLTVQVSVACFSKSVELTVERGFGGSSDPVFDQLVTAPSMWSEYAGAFA